MNIRLLVIILTALIALPKARASGETVVAAPAPDECVNHFLRQDYRQEVRQTFTLSYAEKEYADEEQNQRYIDQTEAATGDIFVDIELSLLKYLNDTVFKNKDLVTALVNRHKEFLIEALAKHFPELQLPATLYSDFKTVRLTLPKPVTTARLAQLEAAFVEANQRFYSDPTVTQITRDVDMSRAWFQMGVGQTADQAARAARFARKDGGGNQVRYYWDPYVQQKLETEFHGAKILYQNILTEFRGSPLLETDPEWTTLKFEVFAEARKAGSAEALLAGLAQYFPGFTVTREMADLILRYTKAVDEFSPPVLVAKKEKLMIRDATYGAVSLDFIGLGAENMKSTAKALAQATTLDQALEFARKEEREVTKRFIANKKLVADTVKRYFNGAVSVRFSGDDGIIIPQKEFALREQLFLVQTLSSLFPRPFFRMAVISARGAATADSSQLITHAESIEKKLRVLMLKKFGLELINELHFSVMIPDSGAVRNVYLVLGIKRDLNDLEKANLKAIFPAAVQAVQDDVQRQGDAIIYEAQDIFGFNGGVYSVRKKPRLAGTL